MVLVEFWSLECASHVQTVCHVSISWMCLPCWDGLGGVFIYWMCLPCWDGRPWVDLLNVPPMLRRSAMSRSPECAYHVETVGHLSISWMCLPCWDDRRSVDQSNSCHVLNCIDLWILIIDWLSILLFFQTLSRTELALVQVSSISRCMILYSLNTETHIIGNIGITATHCIPSFLLFMLVEWNYMSESLLRGFMITDHISFHF